MHSGGAGNDNLLGGKGKAFGDAGNDKITCVDKKPGSVIDGGAGKKDVRIGDKKDVFKRCESIVRR